MFNLDFIADQFESAIRSRGRSYFNAGLVKYIPSANLKQLFFLVRGTENYHVGILIDNTKPIVNFNCTCPYFKDGGNCKHIWACFIKANNLNLLDSSLSQFEFNRVTKIRSTLSNQHNNATLNAIESDIDRTKPTPIPQNLQEWNRLITRQNEKANTNFGERQSYFSKKVSTKKVAKFVISTYSSRSSNLRIEFHHQEYKKNGELGKIKCTHLSHDSLEDFPDPLDQKALRIFFGAKNDYSFYSDTRKLHVDASDSFYYPLLVELSEAKKLYIVNDNLFENIHVDLNPLLLSIKIEQVQQTAGTNIQYSVYAVLANQNKTLKTDAINCQLGNFILSKSTLYLTHMNGFEDWLDYFRNYPELILQKEQLSPFINQVISIPSGPMIVFPEGYNIATHNIFEKVRIKIDFSNHASLFNANLEFKYGNKFIAFDEQTNKYFSETDNTLFQRNREYERIEFEKLKNILNLKSNTTDELILLNTDVLKLIEAAQVLNWEVIYLNRIVHGGDSYKAKTTSGVDWFDLAVELSFKNGGTINIQQLINNLKTGEQLITLADGSLGFINKGWVNKFQSLVHSGKLTENSLRLSPVQALYFSKIYEGDESFSFDKSLKSFSLLITELNTKKSVKLNSRFHGTLRDYQIQGYHWLMTLAKYKIGSILADDMGLGKTIQILAILTSFPKAKTLIVAPKSLVYNWANEAAKFTPHLNFIPHIGGQRHQKSLSDNPFNAIITTYQTLRIDIETFKAIEFDFVILDEAQYIKNSDSQSYMACKLINAKNKIALTGTPIENSISDLFSILSITNPGLINPNFAQKFSKESDPEQLRLLAKSLSPFILRRTKDQVLKDLPKKTEQTLYCDLSSEELKYYNELKSYFWNSLSKKFDEKGFNNSKIEVLEALLRLRQASCHPGLIDKNLVGQSSTKLDLVIEQLDTIIADGHKALIFSQFTSLLALLKTQLDKNQITYEYLDGKTTDRQEKVANFQTNKNINTFLISLKAGGVGLNLTAADYVFILDPWWNPAAESQAIDRVHRIGQKNKVFAYKMIAKNTVEEKILKLQSTKKEVADAIINADKSVLKRLKLDDLKLLFE